MRTLSETNLISRAIFGALVTLSAPLTGLAQGYPKVPSALQAVTDARKKAADERSDKIFAGQMAELKEWATKGKPYLPGAAEPGDLPQASIPAFPGAEGGGMYSFGGRGGKVFVVTHLNDDGPGSFREACEAAGPRIVIFNVAGIIRLKDRIRVRAPYITIAGSTAPGDGVCIAGNTVELETHDIVIRHMRFRRGETDVTDRNDSFGGNPVGNLIIDHVSASWGLDENMSMYRHMYNPGNGSKELKLPTVNVTIQNSIFSEALNTYHHAFGSTIGGLNSTFHHNLWACNTGRNPSVGMYGDFTFVNNVLFNYAHRTVDGGDHRSFFNIINNYLKPGPGTPGKEVAYRLLKPESERSKNVVNNFGKAYVSGNIVEGYDRVTRDNWDGGVQPALATRDGMLEEALKAAPRNVRENPAMLADFTAKAKARIDALTFVTQSLEVALKGIRADTPFKHAPITLQSASEAKDLVLDSAGATLPRRDSIDRRVVDMVRSGKVTAAKMDASTPAKVLAVGYKEELLAEQAESVTKGFITNPSEVGGYPQYTGTPYIDSDRDGLADEWETKHGLNPKDPGDAALDSDGDGYTNIEEFINGTDPKEIHSGMR